MSRGQCERGRAEYGDGEKLAQQLAQDRIGTPGLTVLLWHSRLRKGLRTMDSIKYKTISFFIGVSKLRKVIPS